MSERDRSRSRSPRRTSHKDKDKHSSRRDREREEPAVDLKRQFGVEEISSDDYFLKATEFRLWLKDEKKKYIDELSGEEARRYFKKFVKAWNRGELDRKHYETTSTTALPSSSQTAYKWGFVNNRSRVDKDSLEAARAAVHAASNLQPDLPPGSPSFSSHPSVSSNLPKVFGGRVLGPSMPPSSSASSLPAGRATVSMSESDRTFERENGREAEKDARKREKKRLREEEKEGKSGGREGRIEKRRETNFENRKMRERDEGAGLEVDEGTLMGTDTGDGGSFAARIAARDRAAANQADRRAQQAESRRATVGTSSSAMAAKNQETMEMFKRLAAEKFGGGG